MKKSSVLFIALIVTLVLIGCNTEPAHVHEWGEWETVTAATCTKEGVTGRKCKTCGELDKETKTIDALGHSWNEGEITTEATCTAEGVKTFTCSVCKETKAESVAKAEHTFGELQTEAATCKEDGREYRVCSVCKCEKDEKIISKTTVEHTWNDGEVTTPASCKKGVKTFTCTVCGETKTEEIATTGEHSYGEEQTEDATCSEEGRKYRVCSICGEEKVLSTIAKKDHTWNAGEVTTAATCGKKGVKTFTCSVCGETKTEDIEATGEHSYGEEKTEEATCAKEGRKYRVCSVCGDVNEISKIEKTAHTWNAGEVTSEPTCTAEGVRTYTCTVCGDKSRTESIAVNPDNHSYSWVTDKEATFLTVKTEKEACAFCGNVKSTRKTEEYKSIEGYWMSQELTDTSYDYELDKNVTEKITYYLSFDNVSSGVMDTISLIVDSGTYEAMSVQFSYSWTTDSDGKRTGFKMVASMLGMDEVFNLAPSEDGKGGITLTITDENISFAGDVKAFTVTRKSTEQHTHKAKGEVTVTTREAEYYHLLDTDCGDAHPAVTGLKEVHRYDNTDPDKAELCSRCGYERRYQILVYDSAVDVSDMDNADWVLTTKKDGLELGDTYTPERSSSTIEVESWAFKDGTAVPVDGNKVYHPDKDLVEIVYTKKTSSGT